MELEEIIQGCKNGNEKCQNSLVQLYATRLMALCMRYTHDRDLAKDALQETFINAFKYIHSYSGSGSIEGWLRRIAVNCSLKTIKTMYEIHTLEETAIDTNAFAEVPDVYSTMGKDDIMALLTRLPHSQYVIFNLNIIEGYNHGEIAQMLNITESTSRSTLCKARNRLVEILQNENFTEKLYAKVGT
ncbi:MAG: RNA polymerase sigma factor [Saprospiraceae bacterium]|nr:RNA polymerase sigma factor [Saprospiraceae bacterium]MBP9195411.1 RNA polymerase sigma factor [Saprospiraceae bacterium]